MDLQTVRIETEAAIRERLTQRGNILADAKPMEYMARLIVDGITVEIYIKQMKELYGHGSLRSRPEPLKDRFILETCGNQYRSSKGSFAAKIDEIVEDIRMHVLSTNRALQRVDRAVETATGFLETFGGCLHSYPAGQVTFHGVDGMVRAKCRPSDTTLTLDLPNDQIQKVLVFLANENMIRKSV